MKVRIVSAPQAANGLQVEGGQASHISDSMVMLGGNKHAQGGTDISYNGQNVEAEKGEPVSIGDQGEAIVWGNMTVPGTKTKFKNAAKVLGEQEEKYTKVNSKANGMLAANDPQDKWERLSWNSGRVMQLGSLFAQTEINDKKTHLASLQKALLETAHENNLDPQSLSKGDIKKAKKGAFLQYKGMKAADGTDFGDPKKRKKILANSYANDEPGNLLPDAPAPINNPTRSDRNNNPGNIKYGSYAKSQGATGRDSGGFAVFPDATLGHTAMYNLLTGDRYKNKSVKDAITTWTGGKPYDLTGLGDLQGKKITDLKPDELGNVLDYMKKGEGTKYGVPTGGGTGTVPAPGAPFNATPFTFTPSKLPPVSLTDPKTPDPVNNPSPPPLGDINYTPRGPMPSNVQGLSLNQIMPELYGYATNKEVPVALQKYTPQLYVPYQMSFQDQINDNTATGNAQRRLYHDNPVLASSVGASEYEANNRVRANEFRTNQGIQADTINKNIALNNDAQLKNLQLADTQFVRQSEAKSRTREINQAIMNSISGKYQENQLNNKRLAAYENLYDYRFNDTNRDGIPDQATYYGPDAPLVVPNQGGSSTIGNSDPYSRTVLQTTRNGVTQRVVTPSQQDIQLKQLNLQKQQKKNFWQKLGF
jgi:hypothetical protein